MSKSESKSDAKPDTQHSFSNMLTIVGGIVGLIASCIAIFTFATGYANVSNIFGGNTANSSDAAADQAAIASILAEFMVALGEEDYEAAYELYPIRFDGESSVEKMAEWADTNNVFFTDWDYDEIEIEEDEAYVKVAVDWEDPEDLSTLVVVFSEDDEWRITSVNFEVP